MVPTHRRKLASRFVGLLVVAPPLVASADAFTSASWDLPLPRHPSGKQYSLEREKKNQSTRLIQAPRGGGSYLSQKKRTNSDDGSSSDSQWQQRGMAVALSSTYLTVMGAKCALPSVLSLLTSPKTGLTFPTNATPQSLMARLLGLSTLAVALGKLLLGPLIDALGGIRALQLALTCLTLLIATISCTQSFAVFATCWIFVDFIFSSCWAGCINSIHQSFPREKWGRQIGILAAGARTGNAAAFAFFAAILFSLEDKMRQSWRAVFGLSALLQLIPIALLTHFGGITLNRNKKEWQDPGKLRQHPLKASLVTLRREAQTPEFWLHLLSRSCLMVFASFLLFVPTLMSQVYGSSNAFAAQTGSIYALGCLLSVTTGSQLFSSLPKRKQALTTFILLGGATFSSLMQLMHVSGIWKLGAGVGALSMFLWGASFSIPFYIPPSLYALARGGKESSATIADVFDIGGFSLLAFFNGYVASIQHANPAAWIPTFQLTTTCAVVALLSLTSAVLKS